MTLKSRTWAHFKKRRFASFLTGLFVTVLALPACSESGVDQPGSAIDLATKLTKSDQPVPSLQAVLPARATDDLCQGLTSHKRDVPVKRVAKPPFMKYFKDPAFGTRVIRVTDGGMGAVHKPAYSTVQAWNADESLLMLYRTGKVGRGHILLDGKTYQHVKNLNIEPVDLEEVFWSHTDPDQFFYVSKKSPTLNQFLRYNVQTDKQTLIRDFSKLCTTGFLTAGNGVQMQSYDDDLFGFRCKTKQGNTMFSYKISTDTVHRELMGKGTRWQPWSAPLAAPSGKRLQNRVR